MKLLLKSFKKGFTLIPTENAEYNVEIQNNTIK